MTTPDQTPMSLEEVATFLTILAAFVRGGFCIGFELAWENTFPKVQGVIVNTTDLLHVNAPLPSTGTPSTPSSNGNSVN